MLRVESKGEKAFRLKLKNVKKSLLTRTVMGQMSAQALLMINERTEKGKDREGRAFKRYSPEYAEFKAHRGGGWLDDKGHMLSDMSWTVQSNVRAFIHFSKADERLKASGHTSGSGRMPKRDFFGLTKAEMKEVLEIPNKHLGKLVNA